MTPHLHQQLPHRCQPQRANVRRFPNRPYRKWFLIPLAGLVLALALVSCSGGDSTTAPPPVTVTDTRPVGEGLKLIGFAVLGAAVVTVLGRLLK